MAVLNTMLMAARERTHDIGIMKALGFSDTSVFSTLLIESLLLCVLGGIPALLLAPLVGGIIAMFLGNFLPGYQVTMATQILALLLTVGIGLLAGLVPALQARKLRVAEALRREG